MMTFTPARILAARDSVRQNLRETYTAKGEIETRAIYNMLDQAYREALRNESVRAVFNR